MSSRWYPIYQRGNPQLRVFMTDFWMKLVRPKPEQPENIVLFKIPMEMTRFDVKNYLEKIYNVPVAEVRTEFQMGETYEDYYKRYVKKKDDYKLAYVTLVSNFSTQNKQ